MKQETLIALFYQIRAQNPAAILSGSLAIARQGIKIRRPAQDLDVHIPFGCAFELIPGMVFQGATEYEFIDYVERLSYLYAGNIKVDVFRPKYSRLIEPTVVCEDIECIHFTYIFYYKIQHAFGNKKDSSVKHTIDLLYILIWNTVLRHWSLQNCAMMFLTKNNLGYKTENEIITPQIELTKPLIFFDTETTGVDRVKDRIVELSIIKFYPDGQREIRTERFNPTIPIPVGATDVHHIRDSDVKDCPTFAEKAAEISKYFSGCDFAGYNIIDFDIPIIVEEFLRAGVDLPFNNGTKFLDALKIFYQNEKRDLESAYQFYCSKELSNAHSAEADALATIEILNSQIERYGIGNSVDSVHQISGNGNTVIDYERRFMYNEQGEIVFTFGKHKGTKALENRDYLTWMLAQDFSNHTKFIIRQIIDGKLVKKADDELPY
jgi:DNA polymerase-3 subunit epsilon